MAFYLHYPQGGLNLNSRVFKKGGLYQKMQQFFSYLDWIF